ncbi:MAG TPA: hypothetical protein G4O18_07485 [Dehalococcoidia bacterium]|nr:hypothetical protein [Dehalococcoidia bacterium]
MQTSELWWLTPDEMLKYTWLEVLHTQPYSDEPNSNFQPMSGDEYRSLDTNGNLSIETKRYPINFLNIWRKQAYNINVFRSMVLFSAEVGGDELAGPFVIDIDSDNYNKKTGYDPNINDSLKTTRRIIQKRLSKLHQNDYRIFFTGHKGFNIEVRPQSIGVSHSQNWRDEFKRLLKPLKEMAVGTAIIDNPHCELRLHDSVNHWIANDGTNAYRMKYELSLSELRNMSAQEICNRGENLVESI